jgi:hypothetical protein
MPVHLEASLLDRPETMLQHHLDGVSGEVVLGLPQFRAINDILPHDDRADAKRGLCHTPEEGLAKPITALTELEFEMIGETQLTPKLFISPAQVSASK